MEGSCVLPLRRVPIRRGPVFANSEGYYFANPEGTRFEGILFANSEGSLNADPEGSNFFNERNRRDPNTSVNENKTLSD